MTQRTINLYDGLEALYYFDSDYFDGTTGEIKDKSGHGRHATAQGGPTVGVNGPNDFEAASFDGNDDYFKMPNGNYIQSNEFAVFALATRTEQNDEERLASNYDGGGFRLNYRESNDDFRFGFVSDSGYASIRSDKTKSFGTHTFIAEHSADDVFRLTIDDETIGTKSGLGYQPPPTGTNINIGTDTGGNASPSMTGEVHAFGLWSRSLSQLERNHLTDLTAPLRAQL